MSREADISFNCYREGKIARIAIKPFGNIKWWHHFDHECEGEVEAQLMVDRINEQMEKRVEAIRRNAYEAGKKAARNKDAKLTEFFTCINFEDTGH